MSTLPAACVPAQVGSGLLATLSREVLRSICDKMFVFFEDEPGYFKEVGMLKHRIYGLQVRAGSKPALREAGCLAY